MTYYGDRKGVFRKESKSSVTSFKSNIILGLHRREKSNFTPETLNHPFVVEQIGLDNTG